MEKISVLMSLYDKESECYLNLSLKSIFSQTLMPDEIILVFDGPINAALRGVVAHWEGLLNIRVISLAQNVGLSNALNIGLKACENEIVARFDTDDVCFPERFEKQLSFMANNPSVDICGGFAKFIDSDGIEYSERTLPREHNQIKKLIWSCPVIHPSVMFRKSKVLSIGSYSTTATHRQDDYELWIRAIESGLKFHNLNEYLIQYRYNLDDFKKNTLTVGLNRFKLGFTPWFKYDRRLSSFFGLLYPTIRASIPSSIAIQLNNFVKIYDPRKKS